MKDNIKQQYVRLLVICVILLVFSGCSGERKVQITLEDIRIMSIQDGYPLALEKALEWNSDAYLVNIDLRFQLQSDTKPLKSTYDFQSRNDPTIWLIVYVRELPSGYPIDTSPGEFNEPRPYSVEIIPDDLPFDETEALRLAFGYGGNDFFERFSSPSWPLWISLRERFPLGSGELAWVVCFSDDINRGIMFIYIDPETGEWLEIRENQPVDGEQIKTATK